MSMNLYPDYSPQRKKGQSENAAPSTGAESASEQPLWPQYQTASPQPQPQSAEEYQPEPQPAEELPEPSTSALTEELDFSESATEPVSEGVTEPTLQLDPTAAEAHPTTVVPTITPQSWEPQQPGSYSPASTNGAAYGQPQYEQPVYGTGFGMPTSESEPIEDEPKSLRRRLGIIGATAGVVILIGGTIAGVMVHSHLANTTYSPSRVVEKYCRALVDGKASEANEIYYPNVIDAQRILMSDEVYAAASDRPSACRITNTNITGDTATVDAAITVSGKSDTVTFTLRKAGSQALLFNRWRVDDGPAQAIRLGPAVGKTTTVNGVEVDTSAFASVDPANPSGEGKKDSKNDAAGADRLLYVLPGTYTFAAPASMEYVDFGGDQSLTATPGNYNGADLETLPELAFTPQWSEAAGSAAIDQVKAKVSQCMTANTFKPAGCSSGFEMYEPSYAVTGITRTWKSEPSYTFVTEPADTPGTLPHAFVEFSGGDMKIDYQWRFSEEDTWEPDDTSGYVREQRFPVTLNSDGTLSVDLSKL